jgi:hypothetical protein
LTRDNCLITSSVGFWINSFQRRKPTYSYLRKRAKSPVQSKFGKSDTKNKSKLIRNKVKLLEKLVQIQTKRILNSLSIIFIESNIEFHDEISGIQFSALANGLELTQTLQKRLNYFLMTIAIFVDLASKLLEIFISQNYILANGKLYFSFYVNKVINIPIFLNKSFGVNLSIKGIQALHSDFIRVIKFLHIDIPPNLSCFQDPKDLVCLCSTLLKKYLHN